MAEVLALHHDDESPSYPLSPLACTALLADTQALHPPLLLLHGSANSALVWQLWQRQMAGHGWSSYALDLRGHGHSPAVDLADVRMADYAEDVRMLVRQLRQPPVLIGWSMGGLVAMMVAAAGGIAACVTLAPSMPAQQVDRTIPLRSGVMTAEAYGITSSDPTEQPAMPDLTLEERRLALASLGPESLQARDDRQRGIVIPTLPCPLLVVTGSRDRLWPRERYAGLWLAATHTEMVGASHWGLVLNGRALSTYVPQILTWITQACL